MARIRLIVAALSVLLALASATSAPSFCKCTCFKNSTIIPLNPPHEQTPSDGTGGQPPGLTRRWSLASGDDASAVDNVTFSSSSAASSQHLLPRAGAASCSRCNRAYCLSSGLPICRDAGEDDVVTMCFQRDSRKDEIIVWLFLIGTGGLLGWAAAKRVVEARAARAARAAAAQDPLLGGHGGRPAAGSGPGFFRRMIMAVFRIGNRGSAAGGGSGDGENTGVLRNPFSPRTAEPRGQYSPLAGGGSD